MKLTIINLAVGCAYFLSGKLGLSLAFLHPSATPVWPPSGIALAAVILFGYRVWPAVALGAFILNALTAGSLLTSAFIAVGNTLESVLGGYLVNRFADGRNCFNRINTTLRYLLLAAALSTTVSATMGVTILSSTGFSQWKNYPSVWLTWWLGDFVSDIIVAPALLVWSATSFEFWRRRWVDVLLVSLSVFFVTGLIYTEWFLKQSFPLHFLILPLFIWSSLRLGHHGATLASVISSGIAVFGTLENWGPFAGFEPNQALVLLQAFMGTVSLTGLMLAAILKERSVAQTLLAQQARELSIVNKQLEQFAYASSHDLKEPLRKISNFTDLLMQRLKGAMDQETRKYGENIIAGVSRMKQLIDDLLNYSRIGLEERVKEEVDLTQIVNEVLKDIEMTVQENKAVIHREPLPVLLGHPFQMRQLFQNLILNGIKFHGPAPPEINISAKKRDSEWIFAVKDNGIGIAPIYKDRIFHVFQRLHSRDQYPGTGIGLAICKKIVEGHGGHIWVESEVGQGASFFFTLPADSMQIS